MREILFRAKRLDNGEWIYGGLIWKEEHCCCAELPNTTYKKYYICYYDKEKGRFEDCEVDKETIGQYTNYRDDDAQKIFEGDILYDYGKEKNCCIFFRNSAFMRKFLDSLDSVHNIMYTIAIIIGNIYDNPELLKEMGR